MKKTLSIALLVIIFLVSGSAFAKPIKRERIRVPGDIETIQEAINVAGKDIVIIVASGHYNENLIIYNKSILLVGAGSDTTIINGIGGGPTILLQGSSSLYARGFTIKGDGHGIYANGNCYLSLENSIIEENSRDGVRVRYNSSSKLINSALRLNGQNGLNVSYNSSAEAHQCYFYENDENGIQVSDSSSIALDGNEINDNGFSGLGVTGGSEANLWSNNKIYNNNQSGEDWSGIGIYHNSTIGVGATNEIYLNKGPGIISRMKSHFYLNGTVKENLGHGILLDFDSSAHLGQASIIDNEGYGVCCQNDSITIDMQTYLGNDLGSDNGQCDRKAQWIYPELNPGVEDYGHDTNPVSYFKDRDGVVHLRGCIQRNPPTDTGSRFIFTLEEGYRPSNRESFLALSEVANTKIGIYDNGVVYWYPGPSPSGYVGRLWIDGITFMAAD